MAVIRLQHTRMLVCVIKLREHCGEREEQVILFCPLNHGMTTTNVRHHECLGEQKVTFWTKIRNYFAVVPFCFGSVSSSWRSLLLCAMYAHHIHDGDDPVSSSQEQITFLLFAMCDHHIARKTTCYYYVVSIKDNHQRQKEYTSYPWNLNIKTKNMFDKFISP